MKCAIYLFLILKKKNIFFISLSVFYFSFCLELKQIVTQKIRAGSIEIDSGGVIRNVSRFIIHPDFDEPVAANNDIAILFIDPPLNLTTKKIKKLQYRNQKYMT